MNIALIGNQNTGKTLLFNQLTGSNQRVGNFPGVTVEMKSGEVKLNPSITVVDLPGIYSLSPYSMEEIVTRDYLIGQKPDGIINIIDINNIERNLYLSLQLLELDIPTVLAANMMDELTGNGGTIDIAELSRQIGISVVPISALKNDGVADLVAEVERVVRSGERPRVNDFCEGAVHRCIHAISHIVEDHAENVGVPHRFAATKLIEGDEPMLKALCLSQNEVELIEHSVLEMESDMGTDRQAALADMRYEFITRVCAQTVRKPAESHELARSTRIDAILTHKHLGIPIFFGFMMLSFALTFGVIGAFLSDLMELAIDAVTYATDAALEAAGINPFVHDLIIDGAFMGVGTVLEFVPIIVTLFFFLSIMEDSGYMARVAFIMDKPLRRLGLSGRSFVPMLVGFGCTVPAVMATRTLSGMRERQLSILLIPFMSCAAKLPVYALLAAAFFPGHAAVAMMALYLMGILVAIVCAVVINTQAKATSMPFVMELPNYRFPAARSVARLCWGRAWDFIRRAFTLIFAASVIIWMLQALDFRLNITDDPSLSILAGIGSGLGGIFAPAGFADWRAATALITGFLAKEVVVSTLAVLTGAAADALTPALHTMFSPVSAASFLVFVLLYTPCVAAVATVKRELGWPKALAIVAFQSVVAWTMAVLVYQIGSLIF